MRGICWGRERLGLVPQSSCHRGPAFWHLAGYLKLKLQGLALRPGVKAEKVGEGVIYDFREAVFTP